MRQLTIMYLNMTRDFSWFYVQREIPNDSVTH